MKPSILWTVLISAVIGAWLALVMLEGRIYQRGARNAITKIATTVRQRGQVTINTPTGLMVLKGENERLQFDGFPHRKKN